MGYASIDLQAAHYPSQLTTSAMLISCFVFFLSSVALVALGKHVVVRESDPGWISLVLDTHNRSRTQHGAEAMTWSEDLEPETRQWAEGCQYKHRWAYWSKI